MLVCNELISCFLVLVFICVIEGKNLTITQIRPFVCCDWSVIQWPWDLVESWMLLWLLSLPWSPYWLVYCLRVWSVVPFYLKEIRPLNMNFVTTKINWKCFKIVKFLPSITQINTKTRKHEINSLQTNMIENCSVKWWSERNDSWIM
jgi:hypothetical protein